MLGRISNEDKALSTLVSMQMHPVRVSSIRLSSTPSPRWPASVQLSVSSSSYSSIASLRLPPSARMNIQNTSRNYPLSFQGIFVGHGDIRVGFTVLVSVILRYAPGVKRSSTLAVRNPLS